MEQRRFNPIMIVHFVLMVLVLVSSLYSAVKVLGYIHSNPEAFSNGGMFATLFYGIYKIMTAIAICSGIIYLWNRYGKKAAMYYKAFLFLLVIASLFSVFDLVGIAYAAISRPAIISLVVHIIKIAALLVLVFKKDLGKRRAWIVFCIVLAMDIIIGCISTGPELRPFRIIGLLSRLAMDGTIGLALRGKYLDKASRGTV